MSKITNTNIKTGHALGKSRGASLIEVLIAVLILGIGLLGIASMQAITLRNGQSSMERSQAVVHNYSILDAMRANIELARAPANAYALAKTCAVPAAAPTTLAQTDIKTWLGNVQQTMGSSACGTISCTANVCTVTVEWNDSRGTQGSSSQTVKTVSKI